MTIDELFKSASGGCQNPECTDPHNEVVLHSQCHPNASTWVKVDPKRGKLTVACAICDSPIITVNHTMSN